MSMIPDRIVEEVRERADIVEMIGEHVALRKSGKEYRGLCPFHREKTPSFYVVPAKGFYKCFGCGESGDLFSFLMSRAGLSFPDAVRHVAQRVGVDVPEDEEREAEDPHAPLLAALAFAAGYYAERLLDDDDGRVARRYLERRGVSTSSAERFMLGWAPDDWRELRSAAAAHGIGDDVLLAAGLIREGREGREPLDRFRGRLIFPILDTRGRVVAFGGRLLEPAGNRPKYLNSPEGPVYHKGRELYGLHWARNAARRAGEVLVVEGYMDLIAVASHGLENVVAPLGTAMTDEQAALLARYARKALLLYDSDPAGLRATFRSGDSLLAAGVHPRVATLPSGEDPDSVVSAGGADALSPYLRAAVDVVDRKLQILSERGLLESVAGRRTTLEKVMPTLVATADPALADLYVARVAEVTGIRRNTIETELQERVRRARGRAAPPATSAKGAAGPPESRASQTAPGGRGPAAPADGPAGERQLLRVLVRAPHLVELAARDMSAEEITDPLHREIFAAMLAAGVEREAGTGPLAGTIGPAAGARLEEISSSPEELAHGEEVYRQCVAAIKARRLKAAHDELKERLEEAQRLGDDRSAELLYREIEELRLRRSALSRGEWGIVGGHRGR